MELESQIRTLIENIMECKYLGKIKVEEEEMPGGTLRTAFLYLDTEHSPIIMGIEGTEEEFLNFIEKEIRSRSLDFVSFYKTMLEPTEN